MTDQPDPFDRAMRDTERVIALQRRQLESARIREAIDAGIIDAATGVALLDFWYPAP